MSAKPSSGRPEVFSSMSSIMNNRKNVCLTREKIHSRIQINKQPISQNSEHVLLHIVAG
jgi:hypothetical protein